MSIACNFSVPRQHINNVQSKFFHVLLIIINLQTKTADRGGLLTNLNTRFSPSHTNNARVRSTFNFHLSFLFFFSAEPVRRRIFRCSGVFFSHFLGQVYARCMIGSASPTAHKAGDADSMEI